VMTSHSRDEQLTKYLTDAHSIEEQALAQMKSAPRLAGDPELAGAFVAHLAETKEHERLVNERLKARGAGPAALKDLAGTVTGKGFVLFAQAQPDTPGKLVAHAYSYELLRRVATKAGDSNAVSVSERILVQERAAAAAISTQFPNAVEAALVEQGVGAR